jgi:fructose-bisphosphate aldolase, class I
MGADIIKADPTDDPEDFHRVVEAARVPGAGARRRQGGPAPCSMKSAALMRRARMGMVYGRNIYQHANPGGGARR